MTASDADTFQNRVRDAFKGKYAQVMRRSLQSIVLWEAHRSLESQYAKLRPFQRKYALYATAVELLKTLDFLDYYQRQEVMFRTIASREPTPVDVTWKRMRVLEREVASAVLPRVRAVLAADAAEGTGRERTHDELCAAVLQLAYDESKEAAGAGGGAGAGRPRPANWEYRHNHVFALYRVYYRGTRPDPDIFPATPPKVVEVPLGTAVPGAPPGNVVGAPPPPAPPRPSVLDEIKELSDDRRRAVLREVKEHTELLDTFVGLVPDEEMAAKKRALYELLPPAPLPFAKAEKRKRKKRAKEAAEAAAAAAKAQEEAAAAAAAEEEEDTPPALPPVPALPAMDAAAEEEEEGEPAEQEDWERALQEEADRGVAAER